MIDSTDSRYRDVLLEPFAGNRAQRRRFRVVLGHAVSFWTWRSLCIQHGLSGREALDAMATLALTTQVCPELPVSVPRYFRTLLSYGQGRVGRR